jgi:hypothetical protein
MTCRDGASREGCCSEARGPLCLDLEIVRGDDYNLIIVLTDEAGYPVDITGRTYTAEIRSTSRSATATPFITATNPTLGEVLLQLTDAATTGETPPSGIPASGWWDLKENNGGEITTIYRGRVKAVASITVAA